MIDGTVARKTDSVSTFGSRLDTFADIVFLVSALLKILPVMKISVWIWVWMAVIAVIKTINIISGFICKKRFVVEHTIMNKITGFLLFLLPFTFSFIELKYSAIAVCFIATFAAVQERHYIRSGIEV